MIRNDNLSFPYTYYILPLIGKTFIPQIPITLKTIKGFVAYNFIADTGADLTTLPFFMAKQLNIDLSKAQKSIALGIGNFKMQTWISRADLYFVKDHPITVRVSITNENETPFLLGRVDLLDVLQSWYFDSRRKQIIFEGL